MRAVIVNDFKALRKLALEKYIYFIFPFTIIPDYAIALEFRRLVLVCENRPMAPLFLKMK